MDKAEQNLPKAAHRFEVFHYNGKILELKELKEALYINQKEERAKELGIDTYQLLITDGEIDRVNARVEQLLKGFEPELLTGKAYDQALKNESSKPTKRFVVPKEVDSHKNCYNLINKEVEDYYKKLNRILIGKISLGDVLKTNQKMTVDYCKQQLSKLNPEKYDNEARSLFFRMNYRLSYLGVAPRWRGIVRDRHFKFSKNERTEGQGLYLKDIQVFDLEWIHKHNKGYVVDTSWDNVFSELFESDEFNSQQASIIAALEMKPATKAKFLKLTRDMEKELFMLRTTETDKFINKLIEKSHIVRIDLLTACSRNRRRGTKLKENITIRVDLWLAANIIPGASITTIIENYMMITGETLKRSNCKRILDSMNSALREVESMYLLD